MVLSFAFTGKDNQKKGVECDEQEKGLVVSEREEKKTTRGPRLEEPVGGWGIPQLGIS